MTKSKTSIYDQHDKAFERVSAYMILKDGKLFGKVAFKFPADGAGRLQCFFQVFGLPMVRGTATGYGYDKRSAAFGNAVKAVDVDTDDSREQYAEELGAVDAIQTVLDSYDGWEWETNLRRLGYEVFQAV